MYMYIIKQVITEELGHDFHPYFWLNSDHYLLSYQGIRHLCPFFSNTMESLRSKQKVKGEVLRPRVT